MADEVAAVAEPDAGLTAEQIAARDLHNEKPDQALALDPHPARDEMRADDEPVELVAEAPKPTPTEISDQLPIDTPEATRVRVEVWLAEARYFISTLEHEVRGDAGEIIAWLKARL